jgi:hypothetical protein
MVGQLGVAIRLGIGVAAFVIFGWIASSGGAANQTTGSAFPGFVRAFAADGGRVAWIDSVWLLHTGVVGATGDKSVRYTSQYEEVPDSSGGTILELSRGQLLWLSRRGRGFENVGEHVYAASVSALRGRRTVTYENNGIQGGFVTGLAGDATGFSYSFVRLQASDPDGDPPCMATGGLRSFLGGRWQALPGVPPGLLMARGAGRVALAPTDLNGSCGPPSGSDTIEVRNASTGALVSRLQLGQRVHAVAMSVSMVAVLVGGWISERFVAGRMHVPLLTGARINRYEIDTGTLIGSTPAPARTAVDLDLAGSRLVFRTDRAVELLDTQTGHVSTLAVTSPWQPGGVAIDGNTAVWPESKRIAPGEPSRKTFQTRLQSRILQPVHQSA